MPAFFKVVLTLLLLTSFTCVHAQTQTPSESKDLPRAKTVQFPVDGGQPYPPALKTVGNKVVDSAGNEVWLQGLNVPSLGWSVHGGHRVITQKTLFAMPETGIGLFPDVGGGWYLARLGGRIGQFLALTGARLDGSECLWAGIATHYLPADKLAEAKARIAENPDRIGGILSELSVTPPKARIEENCDRINKHFASDRYEDILASLEADDSEWAAKELATLRTKSPQTCKVALRQLAESEKLDNFADNMRMEYRIASRVLTRPDFAEGVRAVIVDKTHDPKWNPATAEEVSEELIDSIFAPLPDGEEWTPLK